MLSRLGYTFSDHPWKPRISADYVYGSGNKSPFDSVNQTFDIFYGFNQPFSRNDYIAWNNIKDPKARLEFTPLKNVQIDTAFSAYWLASAAAAWDRANLFAPLGNRGTFIGTEYDLRIRYKLSQFINLTASYARFWPGSFTSSFAPPVALQPFFPQSFPGQTTTTNGLTARPTDFFYLEVSANAFGDGNPITKPPGSDFLALFSPEGPPPRPAPPPSWSDVYVGLNGGGAWSSPRSNRAALALRRRRRESGGRCQRDADRPDEPSRRLHRRFPDWRQLEVLRQLLGRRRGGSARRFGQHRHAVASDPRARGRQ